MASESNKGSGLFVLILLAVIYWLRKYPLIASLNVFTFMDGLSFLGYEISPIVCWMFMGLFIGLVYGAWVACKKYNLNRQIIWITAGVSVLVFVILFLVNQPMEFL